MKHAVAAALAAIVLVAGASGQIVAYTLTAAPGTATVAPGTTIPALLFNGALPGPTLAVTQGQTLRVRFVNGLAGHSSLHWHGLRLPSGMDGVIGVSRPAVAPGEEFISEFVAVDPGTYWFHPHVEDQMTSGLYGALVVYPANPSDDPPYDQEQLVILHDDTTAAGGFMGGMSGGTAPGFAGNLLNGATSAGQAPIVVQQGQKLRLRILNAAARASYVIALDGHPLQVTHADGHRVQPVTTAAIPIGPGERWDAIVDLNNPGTWSLAVSSITNRNSVLVRGIVQYAGSVVPPPAANFVPPNLSTGALLSYDQLAAFTPSGAITATPNRSYTLNLAANMGPSGMTFTINGQAWPNVTPFPVSLNDVVQLDLVNTNGLMTGSFRHPMHIHGHLWRLMGTAGGTAAPPLKDTVLIQQVGQPWSTASVQFLADAPGEWPIHCHDAEHMMMGMMNTFAYDGDWDADGLANADDWDPLTKNPVLTIPEVASSFLIGGGAGSLAVQAPAGSAVDFYFSMPGTPIPVPPYGTIFLALMPTYAGSAVASAAQSATLPYMLPNIPSLSGVRFGLQAAASVPYPPWALLSTWQPFTPY
jgi:FtsP/CotA-like multicopper oxidase with cupredoxin domain